MAVLFVCIARAVSLTNVVYFIIYLISYTKLISSINVVYSSLDHWEILNFTMYLVSL